MVAEALPPAPGSELGLGRDLLRAGRITAAVRLLETVAEPAGTPDQTCGVLAALLEARLARGELGPAGRLGARLEAFTTADGTAAALAAHGLGDLATAHGEHEAAAARYTDAGAALGDADEPALVPWRSGAALALTRLGRHREARTLARGHLDAARRAGSPYAVAHALRTVAATSVGAGRLDLLREARAALAGVHAERLAAQIDTDLAVLLTLEGDPASAAEAVERLRCAEAYAGREDLFPLQSRVRGLLERLGEQPHRIRSETLAVLTATEQKAARLAAEGLTNREIAGQLRVTVKAVEWHLSHVYRKLGIRSRTMLADSLGAPA